MYASPRIRRPFLNFKSLLLAERQLAGWWIRRSLFTPFPAVRDGCNVRQLMQTPIGR
jgi:hypothetical protein